MGHDACASFDPSNGWVTFLKETGRKFLTFNQKCSIILVLKVEIGMSSAYYNNAKGALEDTTTGLPVRTYTKDRVSPRNRGYASELAKYVSHTRLQRLALYDFRWVPLKSVVLSKPNNVPYIPL